MQLFMRLEQIQRIFQNRGITGYQLGCLEQDQSLLSGSRLGQAEDRALHYLPAVGWQVLVKSHHARDEFGRSGDSAQLVPKLRIELAHQSESMPGYQAGVTLAEIDWQNHPRQLGLR